MISSPTKAADIPRTGQCNGAPVVANGLHSSMRGTVFQTETTEPYFKAISAVSAVSSLGWAPLNGVGAQKISDFPHLKSAAAVEGWTDWAGGCGGCGGRHSWNCLSVNFFSFRLSPRCAQ